MFVPVNSFNLVRGMNQMNTFRFETAVTPVTSTASSLSVSAAANTPPPPPFLIV